MNKKFTLLATAFLTIGTWSADAADKVPSAEWTAGNYYYLKAGDNYLSLSGSKSDSVIVKTIDADAKKAAIDSALWQIANPETANGITTYKITNKTTKAVLSFAAKADANTNLVAGVDRWNLVESNDGSVIKGFYGTETMALKVDDGNDLVIGDGTSTTKFAVVAPKSDHLLDAAQLGNGFSVFQLIFGDTYEGDIFKEKELVAKDGTESGYEDYVTLQMQGDETFSDGKPKYLGVDTLKTVISGAEGSYGAKFALDSTYEANNVHSVGNKDFQFFKFTVNLKNDSVMMEVKSAPNVNAKSFAPGAPACVVYAQTDNKKVLTVSPIDKMQGALPLITVKRGTPTTIPTGTGVYFLKSANKGATEGKFIASYNETGKEVIVFGGDSMPSVNKARGQWYIKDNEGKYTVVDRLSNTVMLDNQEIFAVKGMADTYVFGDDSVTVSKQQVNLNDKYLGSMYFTTQELKDQAFILNIIPGASGVSQQYAYTTDSVLKGSPDKDIATIFKLVPSDTIEVGGATKLDDHLYVISYKLKGIFNTDTIVVTSNEDTLKMSKANNATSFAFISDVTGNKFTMFTVAGKTFGSKSVSMNINTANLEMTDKLAYVTLEAVNAPEYASFDNVHKRLSYNNNSLVMNPYTLLAEMKTVGNEIATKAGYVEDNFSLWVQKAAVVEGKQLYFISSAMMNGTEKTNASYYLAAKDTLGGRAVFAYNDTIKTMKNSPALFAFKTAEDGGYYLENQSELAKPADERKPYLGSLNGFAIMQAEPSAAFIVETVSAPTPNEEITVSEVKVVGNEGDVLIANAAGRKITLSNILGQNVGTQRASSDNFTMPATKGVILVTVEGVDTYKVIVK